MTERELILRLVDSLQETRTLMIVSHQGDPWYAENEGIEDVSGIYTRSREALEIGEEYRDGISLEDWE
jgi:hypothetical protein